eukprot:769622-Prymnesium_polylepis.1
MAFVARCLVGFACARAVPSGSRTSNAIHTSRPRSTRRSRRATTSATARRAAAHRPRRRATSSRSGAGRRSCSATSTARPRASGRGGGRPVQPHHRPRL